MTGKGCESNRLLDRRQYVALLGASSITLAGCSGDGNGDTNNDGGGTESNDSGDSNGENNTNGGNGDEEDSQPRETDSGIEPITLSGTGEMSGETIQMQEGLVIGEASHGGTGQFRITLEGGQFPKTLASAENGYEGKEASYTENREYTLNVLANGSWNLTIRQPRADSAESPPVSFTGSGSDVVGPVDISEEGSARMSHDGQFAVAATFYPQVVQTAVPLFQSFGEFESDTIHPSYGICWIDIDADGSWTLGFE